MYRSLIFVPGNSRRFIDKAKSLDADIICFDLEDSVPANEKGAARQIIADALDAKKDYAKPLYVRTNSPDSGMVEDDLAVLEKGGIDGIVVPKVNDADEIKQVAKIVGRFQASAGRRISIIPSIETARGVVNAYEIASADARVEAVVFGVFDFLYDMKLDYDEGDASGYAYARSKIPVDARAAGVAAIDGIWQKIDDIEGLARDAEIARRLEYSGKSLIHPGQIAPVHRVFRPSRNQLDWARKVVQALGEANEKGTGRGAVRLDGKMIDAVHYKQAKAILEQDSG